MRYVKWSVLALLALFLLSFLHYTLPQRDIVRVVNTEVRRVDFGANSIFWGSSGSGDAVNAANRDVLFIETVRPNGKPIVYRNEDTGWGWPPYFKFDTANLQAEAADSVSTRESPNWVAIRHYGWRNEWFSIFPNAVSLREVEGPEVTLIPWFNIVFLTFLAGFILWLWTRWRRFREKRIDPVLEDIDEATDEAQARARGWWRRISGR